jgi:hypothetical protein
MGYGHFDTGCENEHETEEALMLCSLITAVNAQTQVLRGILASLGGLPKKSKKDKVSVRVEDIDPEEGNGDSNACDSSLPR